MTCLLFLSLLFLSPPPQHWDAFKYITEIFILVPALLGLKGNLEMTLASRLSTAVRHTHMLSFKYCQTHFCTQTPWISICTFWIQHTHTCSSACSTAPQLFESLRFSYKTCLRCISRWLPGLGVMTSLVWGLKAIRHSRCVTCSYGYVDDVGYT